MTKIICYNLACLISALSIAALSCLNTVSGQSNELLFEHYSSDDGLPHSIVSVICQDNKGFIWLGMGNGLAKFDGYSFTHFKSEHGNPGSLAGSVVRCMEHDIVEGQEILWIGGPNGLSKFNLETEQSTNYYKTDDDNGLCHEDIWSLERDGDSLLWIGTMNGLSKMNIYTEKFTHFFHNPENQNSLIENRVIALIKDNKNDWLWIGTYNNFSRLDTKTNTFHHYTLNKRDYSIYSFFIDHNNELWSAYNSGLIRYIPETDSFKTFPFPSKFNISENNRINRIKEFDDNSLIFSCSEGIFLFNKSTFKYDILATHDIHNSSGLPTNNVEDILIDYSKVLWVGFFKSGLSKADLNSKKFNLITMEKSKANTLLNTNVFSVFEDGKNQIWIGTYNGLYVYNRNNDSFKYLKNIPGLDYTLSSNVIASVLIDSRNVLWVASLQAGLMSLDLNKNPLTNKSGDISKQVRFTRHLPNSAVSNPIAAWSHRSLAEDSNGYIWIASKDGAISKFDHVSGDFINFLPNENNPESIPGKSFWVVYCAPDGWNEQIWLGSFNDGLIRMDTKTNQFFQYEVPGADYLTNSEVRCIHQDSEQNIWVGISEIGLVKMDFSENKSLPKVKLYEVKDGLPNNMVYGILEDANKNLWISTERGISKFDPTTEIFKNFDKTDGLQGNEFNFGAYFQNSNSGELFFGGANGVSHFYPDSIIDNNYAPKVYITDLKIFNNRIKINDTVNERVILNKTITSTKEIILTHKENIFTLEFSALHYANPEENKYEYMLEGFENDWNKVDAERRFASYTNLPPSTYQFKVKAANSDGLWNNQPTILKIIVLPPWWQTWWFRISAMLIFITAIIAYYKYKTREIKKRAAELEKQVAERTAELSNANAELEEQKEEIKQNMEEIEAQRDQIEKAFKNVKVISRFGQRLTSTLSMDSINQMIYEYVSSLMDTAAFGIGVFNAERKIIEFFHFVENGEVLPYFYKDLSSENSLSVRCFKNKEEIVINDLSEEYKRYLGALPEVQTKQLPESMIHIPLTIQERAIGTITINSFKKNAYTENDLTNLRSLASYISIALDNANVYKIVHEQNEHIKAGIEYAKTIQQAILPLKENMDLYFKSFILFRPKDMVSGDFYYFTPVSDGACILAVIDCTGHGVPGAFMSMIGNRLLNDIINGQGIESPAQILEELDKGVQKALKQDQTANNDGMDACLIRVSVESEREERPDSVKDLSALKNENLSAFNNKIQITFSGAMRPLYYIEAGTTEVKQLKGDRRSIGGMRTKRKQNIEFTDQVIELEKNSLLYLTSDGYTDQNNSNRDKLGVVKFIELLQSFTESSMDEQHNILSKELEKHQGNEDQLDDITVVGIKI